MLHTLFFALFGLAERRARSLSPDMSGCDVVEKEVFGNYSVVPSTVYCFQPTYGMVIFGQNISIEGNYVHISARNEESLKYLSKLWNAYGIHFGAFNGVVKITSESKQVIHLARLIPPTDSGEPKDTCFLSEIIVNMDGPQRVKLVRNETVNVGHATNIYNPMGFSVTVSVGENSTGVIDVFPQQTVTMIPASSSMTFSGTSACIQLQPSQDQAREEIDDVVTLLVENKAKDARLPALNIEVQKEPYILTLDVQQVWNQKASIGVIAGIVAASVAFVLCVTAVVLFIRFKSPYTCPCCNCFDKNEGDVETQKVKQELNDEQEQTSAQTQNKNDNVP